MLFHAKNVCFANSWIKVLDVEIAKKKPPNNQEKRGYRFVTTEVNVY